MPSLKAYTPHETLVFCQSVARYGHDETAFEAIANYLNTNQLIRASQTYDRDRLTAPALQELYQNLLVEERSADAPLANGENASGNTNPRKRKLSSSPAGSRDDELSEERFLQLLIDKLYARFREQTIKEIRQEEEAYARIHVEIADLEKRVEYEHEQQAKIEEANAPSQAETPTPPPLEEAPPKTAEPQSSPDAAAAQLHASLDASGSERPTPKTAASSPAATASPSSVRAGPPQPAVASHSPALSTPNAASANLAAEPTPARPLQGQGQPQHLSPAAYQRPLPAQSPPRPTYGPMNQPHLQPSPPGQPMPVLQPLQAMPHMPPPTEYPTPKRGSSSSGQGRGSPVPMQPQQAFPGYPGYSQHPWPHHLPPQHQYPQPPPYANPQYYMHSPTGHPGMPYQTPQHPPYQPYPQSAPLHFQGQPPPHVWHSQPGQPYYGYHGSANITPVARSDSRQPLLRARSSTPWKRRSEPHHNGVRQPSPVRPDREVSPLTDSESPSRARKGRGSSGRKGHRQSENLLSTQDASAARGRPAASATPSGLADSRSQSIASFASDTPTDKRKRGRPPQKVKIEAPSTPAAMLSDTEPTPVPSARRGRPPKGVIASKPDASSTTTAIKRKRSPDQESVPPSLPSPVFAPLPHPTRPDTSLVCVSKNFTKTSQLLLNEIASHKVAGIFAKPLSERDAPGYKDLVLRPQDLKSIKSAISKGVKAALAAIEALEMEDRSGEGAPIRPALGPTSDSGERSLGNGTYLVSKSESLIPPKGIVNSSQLEMELVRMFANAVMFNPLPTSERGFGRSLRLRKRGGDVMPDSEGDVSGSSSGSEEGSPDNEDGIISDTRGMFDDVLALIRKWRQVEVERLGGDDVTGSKIPASAASAPAHGSASASVRYSSVSSALNEDDVTGESGAASTPVPASGTARKRRKVVEA